MNFLEKLVVSHGSLPTDFGWLPTKNVLLTTIYRRKKVESVPHIPAAPLEKKKPDYTLGELHIPYNPWEGYIYLHNWLIFMVNVAKHNVCPMDGHEYVDRKKMSSLYTSNFHGSFSCLSEPVWKLLGFDHVSKQKKGFRL